MTTRFKLVSLITVGVFVITSLNCFNPVCCVSPEPVYVELDVPDATNTHLYGMAKQMGKNPRINCQMAKIESKNEINYQIDQKTGMLSKYIAEQAGLNNDMGEFSEAVTNSLKISMIDSFFTPKEEFIQPVGEEFECTVIMEFEKTSFVDLFISNIESDENATLGVNMDSFKEVVAEIFELD